MFQSTLPSSAFVSYWPGDDLQINFLESANYTELSSNRMKSIQKFIYSHRFTTEVLKGCISSFPNWRFIRECNTDPKNKSKYKDNDTGSDSEDEFVHVSDAQNLRGVARGQRGFLEECRPLVSSRNPLAEFLTNRSTGASAVRLEIYHSIATTAAYLSEKDMQFTSPLYLIAIYKTDLTGNILYYPTWAARTSEIYML